MAQQTLRALKPFCTIGEAERRNVRDALNYPLSGYIGGEHHGGRWVSRLETDWAQAYSVRHTIACNSATTGLLAACMAAGIGSGDEVWTTPYSMSATAACAKVLGAKLRFIDIEPDYFCIDPAKLTVNSWPKALIVANLFGHPADLVALRTWCDEYGVIMIEDAAQSPLAHCGDRYAGTIGHIGVFSLNIHKHVQSGEGGVVVTDDDALRERIYDAVNHGELRGGMTGLNLRMAEVTAAIAVAQLQKAKGLVSERAGLARFVSSAMGQVKGMQVPKVRKGCSHSFYLWAGLHDQRDEVVSRLNAAGVHVRGGYAPLLNKLFNSGDACPVAEDVERRIIIFETCAYDFNKRQMLAMRKAIA